MEASRSTTPRLALRASGVKRGKVARRSLLLSKVILASTRARGESSGLFGETAGTVPASKMPPFVITRLNGGGRGSRTRSHRKRYPGDGARLVASTPIEPLGKRRFRSEEIE